MPIQRQSSASKCEWVIWREGKRRRKTHKRKRPLELMHFFIVTRFLFIVIRTSAYLHEIHNRYQIKRFLFVFVFFFRRSKTFLYFLSLILHLVSISTNRMQAMWIFRKTEKIKSNKQQNSDNNPEMFPFTLLVRKKKKKNSKDDLIWLNRFI